MTYFPESILPKRLKQESVDVDGNKFIVSASDFNRHDEEIRAIEKAIGVPKLPVPGGDAPDDSCSILSVLIQVAEQLKSIRDDFVYSTSGVVAIKDPDVSNIDRLIPFPTSWSVTALVSGFSGLVDSNLKDEDTLDKLDSIILDDVTGMPNEGYVTIINDVSVAPAPVVHTSNLIFYSPPKVNGKVNSDFAYEVLVSVATAVLSVDSTTPLPGGLTLGNGIISGIPTAEGVTAVTLKAVSGSKTVTFNLTITVYEEDTPTLTDTPYSSVATIGTEFEFTIPVVGAIKSITATGIPAGLTIWGSTISGTPREAEEAVINITVIDEFGDSSTGILNLSIG